MRLSFICSPRWSILEPILGWIEGLWDFDYLFIQVMKNHEVGLILVVLAILLWYRQKWEVRRFLTSWKGMKWWLICGNLWIGEMNNFYSEHETPAIDTPEDVAKALRFVWIPYRGHWLEMSNLTQFEIGGTYIVATINILTIIFPTLGKVVLIRRWVLFRPIISHMHNDTQFIRVLLF